MVKFVWRDMTSYQFSVVTLALDGTVVEVQVVKGSKTVISQEKEGQYHELFIDPLLLCTAANNCIAKIAVCCQISEWCDHVLQTVLRVRHFITKWEIKP